jgi:short-subunit dehydrogenase
MARRAGTATGRSTGVGIRGSTAIVTGASRGIGEALAVRLHAGGARVGLVARSAGDLAALADRLGDRVATAPADVGDPSAVRSAIAALTETLGPADVLVNNAGIGAYASVLEEDPDTFERLVRVNYLGTVHATLAVLPTMAARRRGHIVNVASVAGRIGAPFEAAYSGSKFAVVGFSESLSAEVASLGVKVSLVNPGPVATHFTEARGVPFQRERPAPLDPRVVVDAVVSAIETGRFEQVLPRWLRIADISRALLPAAYHRGFLRDSRKDSEALARRLAAAPSPTERTPPAHPTTPTDTSTVGP